MSTIIRGEMGKIERSGDHKRAFMGIPGDGWRELRLEIDTDDCDPDAALATAELLRHIWNCWPAIELARDEIRRRIEARHKTPSGDTDDFYCGTTNGLSIALGILARAMGTEATYPNHITR